MIFFLKVSLWFLFDTGRKNALLLLCGISQIKKARISEMKSLTFEIKPEKGKSAQLLSEHWAEKISNEQTNDRIEWQCRNEFFCHTAEAKQ